ncbi:hypothetical protein [Ornithinimicrobium cryptoxanthini]|uniref:Uncharacterized protein n=1 Tax=Ornithinimicrobium cryptoxanthini TaxID=2934161 RepID=A0ABY4YM78_9MICO|nr:hypothetical protein [Ornithinimicrobium cryptoxanthini]USQ77789.1 hypothetical protein NF557_07815 [Ornithinimicrobium cryptoxanthini]
MSLERQLGLEAEPLVAACSRWCAWQRFHPILGVCDDVHDLRAWVKQADPAEANEVLLALGEIGAVDGGDDPLASTVLLWLLLPGAIRMARSLLPLSDRIDELVAAQLWICVRTVSWRKRVRVASTVLMNTRREVLTDLGVSSSGRPRVFPTANVELLEGSPSPQDNDAAFDLLHSLLQEATSTGLVSRDDCQLLLRLAERSDAVRVACGHGGLLARSATSSVASEWGLSRSTITRRAQRALAALHHAYASEPRSA